MHTQRQINESYNSKTFSSSKFDDSGILDPEGWIPDVLGSSSSAESSVLLCLALARCISADISE